MLRYILKRIFLFIPTLIAISFLTFFISINAPGDPVEILLNRVEGNQSQSAQKSAEEKDYAELHHKLGFDLPLFYFSLTDATVSDTLYKIPNPTVRETLKRLSNEYGSWENVSAYYMAIRKFEVELYSEEKNKYPASQISKAKNLLKDLDRIHDEEKIRNTLNNLLPPPPHMSDSLYSSISEEWTGKEAAFMIELRSSFNKLVEQKNSYQKYIPVIHWYGFRNQYHHWLVNFLRGDFGISYQDKRPVKSVLFGAIGKTLEISLLSILLSYLIAIPLGVHSAIKKGTQSEKTITTTLFVLYSLPNFWIATMLVIFLCGGDYLSWFPAPGGAPIPDDASFWYKFSESIYRLILPLFCWTYGSLAFISRQMRGGILSSITQDYIQTARAKGLDEKKIIWKHAMKNSLLPLIT